MRVGYYVNNEYTDEALQNEPPAKPVIEKVRRNILAEKPRVTRFAIKWDSEESAPAEFPPEQPDVDAQEDDGATYGAEEEEETEEAEVTNGETTAKAAEVDGDADMEGVEAKTEVPEEEDEEDDDDAGSEDLEAESSGEEDELDEEEPEGEDNGENGAEPNGTANGDHEMEMDEPNGKHEQQQQADVMVH